MNSRIAFVTPNLPPAHCGVGDYSARLMETLARSGRVVAAWSRQAAPRFIEGVETRHLPGPWGPRAYARLTRELRSWQPDVVVVQYTPYLYGRRGIHPAFMAWFARLGFQLGVPVALNAHELHYPAGLAPDRLLLGVPQLAQFTALAAVSDLIVFPIQSHLLRYRMLMPWKRGRIHRVASGATIEPGVDGRPILRSDEDEALRLAGVPGRHRVLLQFGSPHPTRLCDFSLAALDSAHARLGPDSVSLVFVGIGADEIERELARAGRMDLKPSVHALGYLSSWQASLWLKRADLVLAPFLDGISLRRTSAMAAFAHSRAVLTTRGPSTDRDVPWETFSEVVAAGDAGAFAARAGTLIADEAERSRLGLAARATFERDYSWPVLGAEFARRLDEARESFRRAEWFPRS